jgi:hypothetical protein
VTALMPVPDTHRGRAVWLGDAGPREARMACGVSCSTVSRALGLPKATVSNWERRIREAPKGAAGAAWCRVVAGFLRHLEVAAQPTWEVPRGLRRPRPDEAATVLLWHANGWLVLGAEGIAAAAERQAS